MPKANEIFIEPIGEFVRMEIGEEAWISVNVRVARSMARDLTNAANLIEYGDAKPRLFRFHKFLRRR